MKLIILIFSFFILFGLAQVNAQSVLEEAPILPSTTDALTEAKQTIIDKTPDFIKDGFVFVFSQIEVWRIRKIDFFKNEQDLQEQQKNKVLAFIFGVGVFVFADQTIFYLTFLFLVILLFWFFWHKIL